MPDALAIARRRDHSRHSSFGGATSWLGGMRLT